MLSFSQKLKVAFLALAFFYNGIENHLFAQEKTYKIGVIGFYNLENLFDTIDGPNKDEEFLPGGSNHYTGAVYLDKLGKLSDVISQIGTDATPDGLSIMGCAEVENESVMVDLVNQPKLKSRNYHIVHYDSPDERGIDVGLIYNPKYFSVKHSEPLFTKLFNDDGSIRYTRDVLYVYGHYDGEPLHIFVNHWPSRRGGEEASAPGRAAAALVCKTKMDSIIQATPDAKIIVMGDLNDDPVSPSVAKVLNAKGKKESVKKSGLYNPWVEFYKNGLGTLAYNDSWNLFDQIMVSEDFLHKDRGGFFFKDAHIFNKGFLVQQTGKYKGYPMRTYDFNKYIGGYSDHFPTYIVFLREVNKK
jgi:hypothetical protein